MDSAVAREYFDRPEEAARQAALATGLAFLAAVGVAGALQAASARARATTRISPAVSFRAPLVTKAERLPASPTGPGAPACPGALERCRASHPFAFIRLPPSAEVSELRRHR
jgi:hypothetical protein